MVDQSEAEYEDSFFRSMFRWGRELKRTIGVFFLALYYLPHVFLLCLSAYAVLRGAMYLGATQQTANHVMVALFYIAVAVVGYRVIDWPWE